MKKVFILLNTRMGWKIVEDDKYHVDATKPLAILKTKEEAIDYCKENSLEIIKICQ